MLIIKKNISKDTLVDTAIIEEIDVSSLLKSYWFTPYTNGMGIETQIETQENSIQILTGFTKETSAFLLLLLALTLIPVSYTHLTLPTIYSV